MMLEEQKLGTAGNLIVVEDYVEGMEMTVLALTDGKTVRILRRARTTSARSTATRATTPAAWAHTRPFRG